MLKSKRLFICACCCCLLITSCKHPSRFSWYDVINKYDQQKADTCYLQSALFLQANHWVTDTTLLTNELIEENIEDAVNAWKRVPSGSRCSWPLFLEWVLPYKILDDRPQSWRLQAREQFAHMTDGVPENDQFSVRLMDTINNNVKQWFAFNVHQSPATWDELMQQKQGDCIAMSRLMAFAGRSYGVPVAIDYSPVWANINAGNHYWNVVLRSGKTNLAFMGAESNPGKYNPFLLFETQLSDGDRNTYKKCAKVFRQTFSANKKSIHQYVQNNADIPYTLSNDHVMDVTSEYYPVNDIAISTPADTSQKIAYLCVYNSGQWVPAAWDTITSNQRAVFANMATDRLYLPAFFKNGIVIPVNDPFIADSTGIHYLKPENTKLATLKIERLSSVEQEQLNLYQHVNKMPWNEFAEKQHRLAAGKDRAVVKNGQRYSLYYWDNQWRLHYTVMAANGSALFRNVPAKGLYKLTASGLVEGKERVFTYVDGEQQWW